MPPEPERECFDVRDALPFLEGEGWRAVAKDRLEAVLGLKRVRVIFKAAAKCPPGEEFPAALEGYGLTAEGEDFAKAIPASGPVVIMANHPFGGADAMSLGALCHEQRPDTLMLANEMAATIPGIGRHMIPLSILGGEGAARKNAPSLRRTLDHLKKGGALMVFPAGEVASWMGSAVEESPWSPHIAALAMKSGAALVTVKFHGKTPFWFHLAGGIHPLVRTALLPRVLHCMRGETVRCRAERVDPASLSGMDAAEAARFLRARTVAMAD